jgi:predicted transcriptional regulator
MMLLSGLEREIPMSVKRITVRVSPELHEQVCQTAARHKLSLNRFVVEALEAHLLRHEAKVEQWPLRQLSELLAPAAEAAELSEEELMRQVRETRRRIWEERYQAATGAIGSDAP